MSKVYKFSKTSDCMIDCFNNKIVDIKKKYKNSFDGLDFGFDDIYEITGSPSNVTYGLNETNLKELPHNLQLEIAESFKCAFMSCSDKCSE